MKKILLFNLFILFISIDLFGQGIIVGPNPSCGTRNVTYCYSGPCNCPSSTWQEAAPATGNVLFSNQTGNCIDVSFTNPGTYTIEYVIGGSCNCTAGNIISYQVTTSNAPRATFTSFDFCENSKNKVNSTDTNGIFSFNPVPTDGAIIDPQTGIVSNGVGGNSYTIKYLIDQGNGCADSTQITINCLAASHPNCSGGCNIISNGNFDIYTTCPTGLSQVPNANDWYNGAFGSADYYNTICGYTSNSNGVLNVPTPVPSPGGVMAFYVNGINHYKEDIGQKVDLCAGQEYLFEIKYAPNNGQYNNILNDAAIYVGNSSFLPVQDDPTTRCPIGFQQLITIPTIGAPAGWSTYTTQFTPTLNTDALILGASCNGTFSARSYLFFDDIKITPIDTVTISVSNTSPCQGDSVALTINVPGGCYGPYDIDITDGTNTYNLVNVSNGYSFNVLPNNTGTTTYTATRIENSFDCSNVANATASVTPQVCAPPPPPTPLDSCNLVLNGGFENFSSCPTASNQLNLLNNWINPINGACQGSTTDFFSCNFNWGGYTNVFGPPPTPYPSDSSFVGIVTNHTNASGCNGYFKEFFGQDLVNLCPNQKYLFNISIVKNNAPNFSGNVENDICLFAGNGLPTTAVGNSCIPNTFPSVACVPANQITNAWTNFSIPFYSTANSSSIIIGPSCGPQATSNGYVYIDEIEIVPVDTLTLSASTLTACPNSPFNVNILIPGCHGPYDVVYIKNGVSDTLVGVTNNYIFTDSVGINTTYNFTSITNSLGCPSPINVPLGITVSSQSSTTINAYDFCHFDSNQIVINGNQSGSFSFSSIPGGGETIDPSTGLITGATANSTYNIQYIIGGACPDTVLDTINALPCDDTCELVENGDFELGNIGFTSPDQTLTNLTCFNDAFYNVLNSVAGCFSGTWVLGKDHTTGTGNFLAVNLNNNTGVAPNPYAYCTSINTQPGRQYSYCMWVANIFDTVTSYAPNPPTVQFELDGSPLGTSFVVPAGGNWYQHGGIFTATTTSSNFCIRQPILHNGLPGMDVAFDDISVKKLADSVTVSINKNQIACTGENVTIDINVYGCPIEYAYQIEIGNWDTLIQVLDSASYTFFLDSSATIDVLSANCQSFWDTSFNIIFKTDTADFITHDYCQGQPHIIQNIGTPGGTYSFNPIPTDGAIINSSTGVISNGVGGSSYTIKYVTPLGCDSINQTVQVYSIDTATISGSGDVCDGTPQTITITFTGTPPWNITYTDGTNITTVNGIASSPYTFTTTDTGTYTITSFTNDLCQGLFSGQAIITGNQIDFTADAVAGCSPLDVNFSNLITLPPGAVCQWNFGDGNSSTTCSSATNQFITPGCYDVTLTVTTPNCNATKIVNDMICVFHNPTLDFDYTPKPLTTYNSTATFENLSQNANYYEWYVDGNLMSSSTGFSHSFPQTEGEYQVCLYGSNPQGCFDTLCKTIKIEEEASIFVPNSFTPDNDGKNDIFIPITFGIDTYELMIFDRWGELIFRTDKIDKHWDGTYKGIDCKTDVYVWKINYTTPTESGKKILHGHVTLLR